MRLLRKSLGSLLLVPLLSVALASGTLAAGVTYATNGFEVAATSTVGTFVGTATTAGDAGLWVASIVHTPLSSAGQADVTGGTFTYRGKTLRIAGAFTGGSVSQTSGFTGCTNQRYDVHGDLTLTSPGPGSGVVNGVLTHYRVWLFGRCITYSATIKGSATFSF